LKFFFFLLGSLTAIVPLLFFYPSSIRRRDVRYFPVIDEDQLPRKGIRMVVFSYEKDKRTLNTRAFIVNNGKDLFALSPVCSHLGCLVTWNRAKGQFLCPCHGGRYDIEGRVISGPPPAPLTRLPMKIEGGKVYIGLKV
jgi:cytochrome b6-f complex iron-sulfur subunit